MTCMSTLLILCLNLLVALAVIPEYIHICHQSDPELAKCIIQSVEALRPRLVSGIPEIDVPPLEPLILPEVVVSRGGENSNYKAIGRNVHIYGPGNFQVTKLKLDIPNMTFFIGVKFSSLKFLADIDVNARILVVPVQGNGKLQANASNCIGNIILKAEIKKTDGIEHMHFKSMDVDLQIENVDVHLENIFGGDAGIGKAINEALNENGHDIFNAIKPVAEKTVSNILLEMINKIVKNLPYTDVFPE